MLSFVFQVIRCDGIIKKISKPLTFCSLLIPKLYGDLDLFRKYAILSFKTQYFLLASFLLKFVSNACIE